MSNFRISLLIFISFLGNVVMFGQQKNGTDAQVASVFYIGEAEKNYEKLVQNYNTLLFTVCNDDMDKAFDNWTSLLKDLEEFANKSNVDLKGVKLWLNVFWDKNGTIKHIVFYPKPNSKNLNYDLVKNVLVNFIHDYQSPLKYSTGFSHYGSAAFPIFSKSVVGPEK
ncbi:MAG: hypothetical protein IPO92_09940 [Saprospiraceae bacterium]|nr:hypothetical protein [Saprospiraceae bacterium]